MSTNIQQCVTCKLELPLGTEIIHSSESQHVFFALKSFTSAKFPVATSTLYPPGSHLCKKCYRLVEKYVDAAGDLSRLVAVACHEYLLSAGR